MSRVKTFTFYTMKEKQNKTVSTCSLRQLHMLWLVHVVAHVQDDPTAHVWINRGKIHISWAQLLLTLHLHWEPFCRHISANSRPMQFKYNIDWCSCWPLKASSMIWRMKPLKCNYTGLTVRGLLPPALLLHPFTISY